MTYISILVDSVKALSFMDLRDKVLQLFSYQSNVKQRQHILDYTHNMYTILLIDIQTDIQEKNI